MKKMTLPYVVITLFVIAFAFVIWHFGLNDYWLYLFIFGVAAYSSVGYFKPRDSNKKK